MKILHLDSNHPILLEQLTAAGYSNTENYTATKSEIEKIMPDYDGIVFFRGLLLGVGLLLTRNFWMQRPA